ncbi:acyl-CoA dehydrogenase family protein [Micromonospora sp. ATA32]|nr:acyl-CoA dehydrogenase family protein [Micromonospora sp. ATA32]
MTTLESVRALLPEVAKRADDVERDRGLPTGLLDQLRAAGCLRMAVPRTHGGSELAMPDVLRVVEALATADGSVAWSIGQVALSQLIIGCAPPVTVAAVYAGGPDVYAAGAVAPKGRATTVDDGWRVSGQWPFVTGCERASWIYLNCVLVSGRTVVMDGERPATRIMLLPVDRVAVVDTWRTLGLRGTGSHDVSVGQVFCPADQALAKGAESAERAATGIAQSSLIIAATAVGIATAALRDVTSLATSGKRPALSATRLQSSLTFQERLGEAQMTLQAARAVVYAQFDDHYTGSRADTDTDGDGDGDGDGALRRARYRAAAAQATAMAAQAVDMAYGLAGGTAIYDGATLQRRMRDVRTATQHFVVGRNSFAAYGALMVGADGGSGA